MLNTCFGSLPGFALFTPYIELQVELGLTYHPTARPTLSTHCTMSVQEKDLAAIFIIKMKMKNCSELSEFLKPIRIVYWQA